MTTDEKVYVFLIAAVILFVAVCLTSLAIAYCRKERHKDTHDFIIHSPSPSVATSTSTPNVPVESASTAAV